MNNLKALAGFVCLALGAYAADNGNGNGNGNPPGAGANGKVIHETRDVHAAGRTGGTFSIDYHGGPVMLGTPNVYYIWYGDWSVSPGAMSILTDLASSIGGSLYFNINTTYYNGAG